MRFISPTTIFKNTVVQIPTLMKLLPIDAEDIVSEQEEDQSPLDKLTLMNYEPEPEEALDAIIPKYINSLIYGGLVEAHASEMVPVCRRWIQRQVMRRT